MENNNGNKVVKAKKASLKSFLTGLAGIIALTSIISIGSCTLNNTNNDNHNVGYGVETEHNHDEHNHDEEITVELDEEDVKQDEEISEVPEEETPEVSEETEEIDIGMEFVIDYGAVVIRNYDGNSIVEGLALNGYNSSFEFRAGLAAYHGIENYRGTAEQNIKLLNILREKALENEDVTPDVVVPETPVQPVVPTPPTPPTPGPEEPGHEHSWSDWKSLNDQKEIRTCSCGERQERNHSYGAWMSNGTDTESRTCKTCGHVQTRDVEHTHNWSSWSSFDDSQEVRTCACGEKDYRSHSYGDWVNNGNNTESRTCSTCGHVQTKDIAHTHSWSDWEYLNDSLEQRECACGEKETRQHTLGTPSVSYENNNDGTHKKITTRHCSTCNHDIVTEKSESCDLGNWTYNSVTGLDERKCSDCGYTETREHIHSEVPDNLVYGNAVTNNNGTHKLSATYTCTLCNQTITLYKDENCEYGEWKDNGTYHSRECEECGYTQQNTHYPDSNGTTITTSSREDHHTESYVCGDCGITISKDVACTSDGTTHYEEVNGVTIEYSNCTVCFDRCDERSHTHNYGEWTYQDEDNEVRSCGCGYGSETRSHNYGEWTYDAASGKLVHTCSGCGNTKTKEHTHSYGTPEKEDSTDESVCYVEVSTCECGDVVRTPVEHSTYERTLAGTTYVLCYNCDYQQALTTTNEEVQTFSLNRSTITEEQYEEVVEEVINEVIQEQEVVEDEVNQEEFPKEEVEEVIYKEEEGEKDLENNEEDTKILTLIP